MGMCLWARISTGIHLWPLNSSILERIKYSLDFCHINKSTKNFFSKKKNRLGGVLIAYGSIK